MKLLKTEALARRLIDSGIVSNLAIRVGRRDEVLAEVYTRGVCDTTLFDMASVTKILSVAALSLIAIDKGLLCVDDAVEKFFEVQPRYKKLMVKHLLTHTMGIGHKDLTASGFSYENIEEHILSLYDSPPGEEVYYSCPAFILMGRIIERIYNARLDELFGRMVAAPLGMTRSGFLPKERGFSDIVNSNVDPEKCAEVNDYNCRYLGGIAGNAGIFSCISDLTLFIRAMLDGGVPLFSRATLDIAAENHTHGMSESRGLGFLFVDGRYRQTGKLFREGAIGHCGHTGTSLFFDRESGLYAIILSDATVTVTKNYGYNYERVKLMRENIHNAIKEDLNL